jgi:lipoate-protein ligase A
LTNRGTHWLNHNHADRKGLSPELWNFLPSGAGQPAFNMALDEALLELDPKLNCPLIRFYGWLQPAASFGYFQRHHEVEKLTMLRPLVRRPTGGGIVPHDKDWTYSIVIPPGHEWYELSARESYRRVHLWVQSAFEQLGVKTELAPAALKTQAGQCFAGHEQSDLLWSGAKIAGAAQRRRQDGLLIQGSVQPQPSWSIHRNRWEQAMLEAVSACGRIDWKRFVPDTGLTQRVMELAQIKYSQESYNQQR